MKSTTTRNVVVTPFFINSQIWSKLKPQTTAKNRNDDEERCRMYFALQSPKMIRKIIMKPVIANNIFDCLLISIIDKFRKRTTFCVFLFSLSIPEERIICKIAKSNYGS